MRYKIVVATFIGMMLVGSQSPAVEGETLSAGVSHRCGELVLRTGGSVCGMNSHNRAKLVISASRDHIQVWDRVSGRSAIVIPSPKESGKALTREEMDRMPIGLDYMHGRISTSPDGKSILFPHFGKLNRYSLPFEKPPVEFTPIAADEGVSAAAYSMAGESIYALSSHGQLFEFSTKTDLWKKIEGMQVSMSPKTHMHLAVANGAVAIAGRKGESGGRVRIWDTERNRSAGLWETEEAIDALALSADGKKIALHFAGKDGKSNVEIRSVADRELIMSANHKTAPVVGLSADGSRLALAGPGPEGYRVEAFDTATGKRLQSWPLIGDEINHLLFLPNGAELLAAGKQGVIHHWDVKTGKPMHPVVGHAGAVQAVIALGEGRTVTGADDGIAILWDKAGKEVRRFVGHKQPVTCLASDGRSLFSGALDGTVRCWSLADGTELRSIKFDKPADGTGVYALALSHDAKDLAVGLSSGVRLLSAANLKQTGELVVPKPAVETPKDRLRNSIRALVYSKGGSLVASARSGELRVWDLARPAENRIVELGAPNDTSRWQRSTDSIAITPDGKALGMAILPRNAFGGSNKTMDLGLWDLATGKMTERIELVPLPAWVSGLTFTPDGKRAVLSEENGRRIWVVDLEKKKIVQTFESPCRVLSLAVAPDGKTFVTGGSDTTALVWKLDAK